MSLKEALTFLIHQSPTIYAYLEKLRMDDYSFRHTNIPMTTDLSDPTFLIKTHLGGFNAWHEVLGGAQFSGLSATGSAGSEVPQMQWDATESSAGHLSTNQKRDMTGSVQNQAAAVHQITSTLDTLEGLGLIAPYQIWKRSEGEDWSVEQNNDVYTVQLDSSHFHNDIKKQRCSIDNYTGNQTENIQTCHDVLTKTADDIGAKLRKSVSTLDDTINWRHGAPSPWATKLGKRMGTYSAAVRTVGLDVDFRKNTYQDKVFTNMKNSLVSKAYADEMCYNRCANDVVGDYNGGVSCITGCYDVTEQRFEDLYGLDPDKSLAAEKHPWSLNASQIMAQSWYAYEQKSSEGWLPGSFNVDPFGQHFRDYSPVLPTCFSDYQTMPSGNSYHEGTSHVPCTCGNKYGDESERFWAASQWANYDKHYDRNMLESCLKDNRLSTLAQTDPGAYLVNMCQLHYQAIAPLGSYFQTKNRGHYAENQLMCTRVAYFYDDHKDRDDAFLNDNLCKIWAAHADDMHKNLKVDFSHINSALRKGGCGAYRDWWKHECDKGKNVHGCGYPQGY
jgi:hypothetical protein